MVVGFSFLPTARAHGITTMPWLPPCPSEVFFEFFDCEMSLAQDGSQNRRTEVPRMHGDGREEIAALELQMTSFLANLVETHPLEDCNQFLRTGNGQLRQRREP